MKCNLNCDWLEDLYKLGLEDKSNSLQLILENLQGNSILVYIFGSEQQKEIIIKNKAEYYELVAHALDCSKLNSTQVVCFLSCFQYYKKYEWFSIILTKCIDRLKELNRQSLVDKYTKWLNNDN